MLKLLAASALMTLSVAADAAAPADPVMQKLVAGARAVPPAAIRYERSSKTTGREETGATETSTRVDRWNGQTMQRITTDGRPATADENAKLAKATKGRPVPGYHRIADFMSGGARRIGEKPGEIIYRIDRLPKGSIDLNGDRSDKFSADVIVDTSGAAPVARQMHIFLPRPFSIMFVAKVDKFDIVNEYSIGRDGRPALVKSVQQMAGAQFGKVGEQRTESIYSPLK
jgi:hypothetical protein